MTDHATVFGVCENKCFVEVSPKSDTDAVEARVEALETEIGDTDIKTRLDAIDGEVDALQANDTAQNASISALQTQVAELAKSTGNRVMYTSVGSSAKTTISGAISGDTSLIDDGYNVIRMITYSSSSSNGYTLDKWFRDVRNGLIIDFSIDTETSENNTTNYTYSVMGSQITDAEFDAILNDFSKNVVHFAGTFKIDYTIGGNYTGYQSSVGFVAKGTLTIEDGKIVSKTLEKINNKVYAFSNTFYFHVDIDRSTITKV